MLCCRFPSIKRPSAIHCLDRSRFPPAVFGFPCKWEMQPFRYSDVLILTPRLKEGQGACGRDILIGNSGSSIADGHSSKKWFSNAYFYFPIFSPCHFPVTLVFLATIYSPACQVFNSSTCTHAHLHTHTYTPNHEHVRVVRSAQLCRLYSGRVVIVSEGDPGFPLKSHHAEHLFMKALGAEEEQWVK